jgi:methylmalonyl-CoA/ethylmalonyl-CoA epimerase
MTTPTPAGGDIFDGAIAIDHVGIATADLEATVELYATAFGMREVHREVNTEQQVVEVMLAAADDGTAARLQVLAPLGPESAIARFLDRSGPGLQQLALRVTDIAATEARIRQQGLRLLYPQSRSGTAGSKINFVHPKDAGGVLVELVQPAAG